MGVETIYSAVDLLFQQDIVLILNFNLGLHDRDPYRVLVQGRSRVKCGQMWVKVKHCGTSTSDVKCPGIYNSEKIPWLYTQVNTQNL